MDRARGGSFYLLKATFQSCGEGQVTVRVDGDQDNTVFRFFGVHQSRGAKGSAVSRCRASSNVMSVSQIVGRLR